MTEKMTAVQMYAPGDLRVEQADVPAPGPGEMLVAVAACGVCGSDIPRMHVNGAFRAPIIGGHEFSGHVVSVERRAAVGAASVVDDDGLGIAVRLPDEVVRIVVFRYLRRTA